LPWLDFVAWLDFWLCLIFWLGLTRILWSSLIFLVWLDII
jgi:hypothetical protein